MLLDWLKFPGFKLPLPYLWQRARHEMPVAVMLPTGSLVTEHDVKCSEGWYFRVLRLRKPVPFETAQPHVVLDLHETKAHLLATLNAEGEITINEYQSQHFAYDRLDPIEGDGYAVELNDDYDAHLAASPFLMREHFIVIAFRLDQEGSRPRTADDFARIQAESVHVLDGLTQSALAMLQPFEPVLLGSYWRDGVRFSQVLEFLTLLVNGRTQPMRHTRAPLCALLPAVRVSGRDGLVELRSLNWVRYAAMLGVKEYIEEPECGLLDAALYVPVEWLDTIAGRFYDRRSALDALQRQYSHLLSAADRSESQIAELRLAMDDVQAGRYRMLKFFYNKAVFGDTPEQALAAAARVKGAISRATGLEMAQVDMIPDAAWWAQVPTNFWLQPREADLSSRVFAAMACTHGFASGKRDGNPWGQAVIILMTDSGQPFYLSLHESPRGEVNIGQKWPGTFGIYGKTGTGKTTIQWAIAVLSRRWSPRPRIVVLDKDRSCEIAVRALGGIYLQMQVGQPTGLQPFQHEPTEERIAAWINLVLACLWDATMPFQPVERQHVENAVRAMSRMPAHLRGMTTIRQNLPTRGPREAGNNIWDRIGRWCRGGVHGWVFDGAGNALPPPVQAEIVGIDYTRFLDLPEIRGPVMLALLQYFADVIGDGRRLMAFIVEFWRAVQDPHIAAFAEDAVRTIRKKGGLLAYDTQTPGEVLDSAIGPALASQTSTLLLLPDTHPRREHYIDGLGLNEQQFDLLANLHHRGGHRFLVVQGDQSAVCQFDLSDMQHHLAVLSADTEKLAALDRARAECGDDPKRWLPRLRELVLGVQQLHAAHLRRAA